MSQLNYEDFIEQECKLISSDGCTSATNYQKFCCKVHDLEYHYKKMAKSAYQLYSLGHVLYWEYALTTNKSDSDTRFRKCLQYYSPLGIFSPFPWIRFLAVKLFGSW